MTQVFLNIYDFTKYNSLLHCLGIGLYHTTIQIDDQEIGFGIANNCDTGVYIETVERKRSKTENGDLINVSNGDQNNFSHEQNHSNNDQEENGCDSYNPKLSNFNQKNYFFREQVSLGICELPNSEILNIIDDLKIEYLGMTYDIFEKNCNNFTQDLSQSLVNKRLPSYLFRMTNFLNLFRACIPNKFLNQSENVPFRDSRIINQKKIIKKKIKKLKDQEMQLIVNKAESL